MDQGLRVSGQHKFSDEMELSTKCEYDFGVLGWSIGGVVFPSEHYSLETKDGFHIFTRIVKGPVDTPEKLTGTFTVQHFHNGELISSVNLENPIVMDGKNAILNIDLSRCNGFKDFYFLPCPEVGRRGIKRSHWNYPSKEFKCVDYGEYWTIVRIEFVADQFSARQFHKDTYGLNNIQVDDSNRLFQFYLLSEV